MDAGIQLVQSRPLCKKRSDVVFLCYSLEKRLKYTHLQPRKRLRKGLDIRILSGSVPSWSKLPIKGPAKDNLHLIGARLHWIGTTAKTD